MDQNGDGKLSVDELPEPLRDRLSTADTNGDGFYDAEELTAAFANSGGGGSDRESGARGPGGDGPGESGPGGEGVPSGGPAGGGP
jgi:hypothetical protein